jgi:Leucine-rich repeat (LRR) protein
VCSWPGVGCDIQQVYILNLTITGAGLTGPVAENSLGKLMNLEFLDLDDNFITELASDIWGLSKLKYLSLSNNNLSGALSNNIGNFGVLSRLDLSRKRLLDSILQALGSLTVLHSLNLSHNLFNGGIPQEIFSLKSLVRLDISSNQLTGGIPQGLNQFLPKLRTLCLVENQLT